MIVIGIVPWDELFALDIRADTLIMLNSGGLLFTGLLLLQFIYLVKAFLTEGARRVVRITLLTSGILFSFLLLSLNAILNPDMWQDRGIYQNGNNYLILQFNAFGITGERTVWRLIETQQTDCPVRFIKIIKTGRLRSQLNLPEFSSDYVNPIPALKWDRKTWRLVRFD